MALLNETKEDLDNQFGVPKKAQALVGGGKLFEAEATYCYNVGRFLVTIGFRNDIARYASFAKDRRDEQAFDDRDVDVCLALLAPESYWSLCNKDSAEGEAASEAAQAGDPTWIISQYETILRDTRGNELAIVASQRKVRPYVLAYVLDAIPSRLTHAQDRKRANSEKLDHLALKMNTATTPERKIDAVIAVLNELLSERRAAAEEETQGESMRGRPQ